MRVKKDSDTATDPAAKPTRTRSAPVPKDPEVEAVRTVYAALDGLTPKARARVLNGAVDRYLENPPPDPQSFASPTDGYVESGGA